MAGKAAETGLAGLVLLGALVVGAATLGLVAAVVGLVLWLVVRHPFCLAVAAATAGAWIAGGPLAAVALWAALAGGALAWRAAWRDSFDRRVLHRWRRTFVYGRRWRRALAACDLDGNARSGSGRLLMPRLGSVRSRGLVDTVSVRPLDDQDMRCFAARADDLAHALGAASCEVHADATGAVHLVLRRRPWLSRRTVVGEPTDLLRTPAVAAIRAAHCAHGTHRRVRAAA
jgi:DNA segregation ATPase FtsK/SpoIIIE, S-DNA-T family